MNMPNSSDLVHDDESEPSRVTRLFMRFDSPLPPSNRGERYLFKSVRPPLRRYILAFACSAEGEARSTQPALPDVIAEVMLALGTGRSLPHVVSYGFFSPPPGNYRDWREIKAGIWVRRLRIGFRRRLSELVSRRHRQICVIKTSQPEPLREMVEAREWSYSTGVLILFFENAEAGSPQLIEHIALHPGFCDRDFDESALIAYPGFDGEQVHFVSRNLQPNEFQHAVTAVAERHALELVSDGF